MQTAALKGSMTASDQQDQDAALLETWNSSEAKDISSIEEDEFGQGLPESEPRPEAEVKAKPEVQIDAEVGTQVENEFTTAE